VGKREEMSSAKSACQQGVLKHGKKAKQRPHPYEYSCGNASRVNEDDEKLKTFVIEERG
jgi:hypothetical protein